MCLTFSITLSTKLFLSKNKDETARQGHKNEKLFQRGLEKEIRNKSRQKVLIRPQTKSIVSIFQHDFVVHILVVPYKVKKFDYLHE
jgi:hypothetical protein